MVAAGEGSNPAHSAVGGFYNLRSFAVLQQPREKTKTLKKAMRKDEEFAGIFLQKR